MTTFELLFVAHIVGDLLLQTEIQAIKKMQGKFLNKYLVAHCGVYTLVFIPVIIITKLHICWLLAIFLSHLIIDRRWLPVWWREKISRNSKSVLEQNPWLTMITDQVFHVLVLAIIAGI